MKSKSYPDGDTHKKNNLKIVLNVFFSLVTSIILNILISVILIFCFVFSLTVQQSYNHYRYHTVLYNLLFSPNEILLSHKIPLHSLLLHFIRPHLIPWLVSFSKPPFFCIIQTLNTFNLVHFNGIDLYHVAFPIMLVFQNQILYTLFYSY